MAKKAIKSYSLSEMKDKYIGKADTAEREVYEYELRPGTQPDSRAVRKTCWCAKGANF